MKILIGLEKAETAKQFHLPLGSGKNKKPILIGLKNFQTRSLCDCKRFQTENVSGPDTVYVCEARIYRAECSDFQIRSRPEK